MTRVWPTAVLFALVCGASAAAQDPVGFRRRKSAFPDDSSGKRVALGDVDLDGDVDALISGRLYLNDGRGNFTLARRTGLRPSKAAILIDYDKDGDLDVFRADPDRLLRNDLTNGKPRFVDVSAQAGIQDDGHPTEGLAAGDLNGDGFPDFYLANYERSLSAGTPDRLYVSQRKGRYRVSAQVSSRYSARGVHMVDFDHDGDLDVYVSNYRLDPNLLYVNRLRETGGFTLQLANRYLPPTEQTNLAPFIYQPKSHTIGSIWGDVTNNGRLDLVLGNFSHRGPRWGPQPMVQIYEQGSDRRFRSVTGSDRGIVWQEAHVNPTLFDLDDDGDLDLYLTSTYGRKSHLYRNRLGRVGTSRMFRDVTDEVRSAVFDGWGCAAADLDGDGDQDLVVGRGRGKPIALFNERAQRRPGVRSVRVSLRGRASDRFGIGARVILRGGGAKRQVRVLAAGEGTGCQSEPVAHFGVGRSAGPYQVTVRWPSGRTTVKRGVQAGRLRLWEPRRR
jgi:enediyne biosynthesis protein E4